jgi:protein TonB
MIRQYSWASVKKQQRKHIEFGTMITLVLATMTFYAVPEFGPNAPVIEEYTPPPIDVVNIPATTQPPVKVKPLTPAIPIPADNTMDIDPEIPWVDDYDGLPIEFLEKPEEILPIVPLWMVSTEPKPIGGYAAILKNITYPEVAREAGIEGRVLVEALIGIDGFVEDAIVVEGYPRTGLDAAALEAVLMTRFSPAYQMDKPVRVKLAIPIVFRLRN